MQQTIPVGQLIAVSQHFVLWHPTHRHVHLTTATEARRLQQDKVDTEKALLQADMQLLVGAGLGLFTSTYAEVKAA
jgi:hypothetical protein